jgi:hypothetical protein
MMVWVACMWQSDCDILPVFDTMALHLRIEKLIVKKKRRRKNCNRKRAIGVVNLDLCSW